MIKQNWQKNIIISLLFSSFIYYLWKLGILYSYSFYPVVSDGRLHVFADWAAPIKLAVCHKSGFNVLYPSECLNYPFNYGNLILYTPIFKPLENFYFYYFPLALCSVFI